MGAALQARILAADIGDGFMTPQISELLRDVCPHWGLPRLELTPCL